jgi:hypothetical protein
VNKQSQNVINWRKRTKERIVKAMGSQCQICFYDRCLAALELHHLDSSTKEFGFGSIRANPKSIDAIKTELKKCILLCANCHREVHAGIICLPTEYKTLDECLLYPEVKQKTLVEKRDRRKLPLTDLQVSDILSSKYAGNKSEMARSFGVSETTIRKRLKKFSP